jgi:hypothetical protein
MVGFVLVPGYNNTTFVACFDISIERQAFAWESPFGLYVRIRVQYLLWDQGYYAPSISK